MIIILSPDDAELLHRQLDLLIEINEDQIRDMESGLPKDYKSRIKYIEKVNVETASLMRIRSTIGPGERERQHPVIPPVPTLPPVSNTADTALPLVEPSPEQQPVQSPQKKRGRPAIPISVKIDRLAAELDVTVEQLESTQKESTLRDILQQKADRIREKIKELEDSEEV